MSHMRLALWINLGSFLVLFALLTSPQDARGQGSSSLVIIPAKPTAGQVFEVDMHAPGGCTSVGTITSEVQTGNIIVLHVVPSGALLAGGPCTEKAFLSGIPAGTYNLQWVTRLELNPPLTIQVASTTVIVSGQATSPIALPVLDGIVGVILASLTLAATALVFRRK